MVPFRHKPLPAALAVALLAALPSGAAEIAPSHCLWTATKDGRTHHLLGSVHVLKPTDFPLAAPIREAYADSQRVIFEADIDALNSPKVQRRMIELGMYPEGTSLFETLPAPLAKDLKAALAKRRMPALLFDRQRPWMVAVTLPVLELQRLGYSALHGVDQHFHRLASKDDKQLGFLETADFQLQLLSGFPEKEQIAFLEKTVAELGEAGELIGSMMKVWKSGDTGTLGETLVESFDDHPGLYAKMLTDRNKAWIPKLERWFAADETCLVVVGAGHLVGEDSVVELLRKKGWKVEQR